jgi:hypothetical protein
MSTLLGHLKCVLGHFEMCCKSAYKVENRQKLLPDLDEGRIVTHEAIILRMGKVWTFKV